MKQSDFDPAHQIQSLESKIVVSLERIAEAFRVLLWQKSKAHALTPIQIQILIFLLHHNEDKRKVSILAKEFNMTKATISEAIKTLEQKKLITKSYLREDTRSYQIHLTDAGKELATEISLFTKEIHAPIMALPEEAKNQLLLNLLSIIDHLYKAGVISLQRMCFTCLNYEYRDSQQAHFCKLLNQELHPSNLRVNCQEHQARQATATI